MKKTLSLVLFAAMGLTTIKNQGDEIEMKDKEITRLKARLEKYEAAKPAAKKPAAKKAPAKKAE